MTALVMTMATSVAGCQLTGIEAVAMKVKADEVYTELFSIARGISTMLGPGGLLE